MSRTPGSITAIYRLCLKEPCSCEFKLFASYFRTIQYKEFICSVHVRWKVFRKRFFKSGSRDLERR